MSPRLSCQAQKTTTDRLVRQARAPPSAIGPAQATFPNSSRGVEKPEPRFHSNLSHHGMDMTMNKSISRLANAAALESFENARGLQAALQRLPADLAHGLHAPLERIQAALAQEKKRIFDTDFIGDLGDLSSALANAMKNEVREAVIWDEGAVRPYVEARLTERGERISSVRSTIDALKASAQRTNDLVDAPRILAALGEGRSGQPA